METTINHRSDVEALFSKADGIKTVYFRKNQQVFLQGDISRSIFYIVEGAIKLTVLSTRGKEALVAVLHEGEFFGESCIAWDQPLRPYNAFALTATQARQVQRNAMIGMLAETGFCSAFINFLLRRETQTQSDLASALLDNSKERLVRALSVLSKLRGPGKQDLIGHVSQQTLAEMIGTTRQRVNYLLKYLHNWPL